MKNLVSIIFMVLLLFLFVGQPAISGPPPPGWNRMIPDPLHEHPWDELASSSQDRGLGEQSIVSTTCVENVNIGSHEYLSDYRVIVAVISVKLIYLDFISLDDEYFKRKIPGVGEGLSKK